MLVISAIMERMAEGEVDVASGARSAANSGIMYELDLQRGELQWSNALYTTFNYPHSEPFNRVEWWVEHIHPEDAMILNQAMDKLDDPKIPNWVVEYRFRSGDGSYAYVRDRASILRDPSGRPTKLIGTIVPIATQSRGIVA